MHQPARFLIATLLPTLLGAAAGSVSANDGAAVWQAAQHADARANVAEQTLSDRYTAIWSSLDASQKARFSVQERACLNHGRQREQQACVARNGAGGARAELVVKTCEAEVLERHLGALAAAPRDASSH